MHLLAISCEFSFPKLHFYVAFKTLVYYVPSNISLRKGLLEFVFVPVT